MRIDGGVAAFVVQKKEKVLSVLKYLKKDERVLTGTQLENYFGKPFSFHLRRLENGRSKTLGGQKEGD
jgi:hypothetical protein